MVMFTTDCDQILTQTIKPGPWDGSTHWTEAQTKNLTETQKLEWSWISATFPYLNPHPVMKAHTPRENNNRLSWEC